MFHHLIVAKRLPVGIDERLRPVFRAPNLVIGQLVTLHRRLRAVSFFAPSRSVFQNPIKIVYQFCGICTARGGSFHFANHAPAPAIGATQTDVRLRLFVEQTSVIHPAFTGSGCWRGRENLKRFRAEVKP